MLRLFEKFVFLFQLHACKLAKLSACIAKCMSFLTIFFNNFFLNPVTGSSVLSIP